MKYLVKCPYCEHTYFVDSKAKDEDFQCHTCGGQNSIDDVIERVQDEVIVEKEVIKTVIQKEVIDPELEAIKSFDIARYPVNESSQSEYDSDSSPGSILAQIVIGVAAGIICIAMAYGSSSYKTEEERMKEEIQQQANQLAEKQENSAKNSTEASESKALLKDWIAALQNQDLYTLRTCYNIPNGSVLESEDLLQMIENSYMKELWGKDVALGEITFVNYTRHIDSVYYISSILDVSSLTYKVDFSNNTSANIRFVKTESDEMKIELSGLPTVSNITVKTAHNKDLFIDDTVIDIPFEEIEDEEGMLYSQYTIPYIMQGEHVFTLNTSIGNLTMRAEVSTNKQEIVLDHLTVSEETEMEISAALADMWSQVQTLALNYADPSEMRPFFDARITDEEIEDMAKQIRMEQSLRGNYEGASVLGVQLPDQGIFCAVSNDTYVIEVETQYVTMNEKHLSGANISKIGIIHTDEGWKIYENYENAFFTLASVEKE